MQGKAAGLREIEQLLGCTPEVVAKEFSVALKQEHKA
jgi:hypothetical protein